MSNIDQFGPTQCYNIGVAGGEAHVGQQVLKDIARDLGNRVEKRFIGARGGRGAQPKVLTVTLKTTPMSIGR